MDSYQQAPAVGRASKSVTVGGVNFTVRSLPPRQGLRVCFMIATKFGVSIGALLSGGLEVEIDGDTVVVSLEEALKIPSGREILLGKLLDGLSSMTPEDLDALVCDLLIASPPVLSYTNKGGGETPVISAEQLDDVVLGPMELLALARVSLTMSALPTSADDRTDGGSSADET